MDSSTKQKIISNQVSSTIILFPTTNIDLLSRRIAIIPLSNHQAISQTATKSTNPMTTNPYNLNLNTKRTSDQTIQATTSMIINPTFLRIPIHTLKIIRYTSHQTNMVMVLLIWGLQSIHPISQVRPLFLSLQSRHLYQHSMVLSLTTQKLENSILNLQHLMKHMPANPLMTQTHIFQQLLSRRMTTLSHHIIQMILEIITKTLHPQTYCPS